MMSSVFTDIGSRLVFPPAPQPVYEERNKEKVCIFIYKNDGYHDSKNEVWLVEMRSSLRLGP